MQSQNLIGAMSHRCKVADGYAEVLLASILPGVYQRGLMGTASSTKALERGRLTGSISDLAWSFIVNGS
jgi:hypothetical protein